MHARYTLILRLFLLFALSSSAIAADPAESKAIAVARAATLNYCTTQTPCSFQASRYGEGWLVLVEFTKRDSPTRSFATVAGPAPLARLERT